MIEIFLNFWNKFSLVIKSGRKIRHQINTLLGDCIPEGSGKDERPNTEKLKPFCLHLRAAIPG